MKHLTPVIVMLTGCAASSAGIYRTSVETTVASGRSSKDVALCVSEHLFGGNYNSLRNDGDHYWITRQNALGSPLVRWDFLPAPAGGSIAELRTTVHIGGTAADKVRACAQSEIR